MYLPQEAQKSFTAAVVAFGGVVSRPATDAVRNGSQIADRFTINRFFGKQKRTRFQCFHISWKPLKPSPKLCILFFTDKIDICLYFDLYSLQNFSLWGFKSSQRPKIPQCHPSFFQEFWSVILKEQSTNTQKSGRIKIIKPERENDYEVQ